MLRERGVAADDLAARAALATVTTLTYLGLRTWAEGDGTDAARRHRRPLPRPDPDPTRFGDVVHASRN